MFSGFTVAEGTLESPMHCGEQHDGKSESLYKGGVQKKKSCNIVTTYVGNYTKFIYFFHGPNSSKSAKKFFVGWGGGLGGWLVGT